MFIFQLDSLLLRRNIVATAFFELNTKAVSGNNHKGLQNRRTLLLQYPPISFGNMTAHDHQCSRIDATSY